MRVKKFIAGFVIGMALVMPMMSVTAQEALTLGEPVTIELSADSEISSFTYAGTANEVVVLSFGYTEDDFYVDPSLSITGPDGVVLSTFDDYVTSPAIFLLPADGEYEVTLRKAEDTETGEVAVSVSNPVELTLDTEVSAERTNADETYYIYRGAEDFSLVYTQQEANMPFTLTVNRFSEYSVGSVLEAATLSGDVITQGTIGVIPGGETYVLRVTEGFYFPMESSTTEYTLTAVTAAR